MLTFSGLHFLFYKYPMNFQQGLVQPPVVQNLSKRITVRWLDSNPIFARHPSSFCYTFQRCFSREIFFRSSGGTGEAGAVSRERWQDAFCLLTTTSRLSQSRQGTIDGLWIFRNGDVAQFQYRILGCSFCTLLFCNPYFGPFFQGSQTTKVFKTRPVGAD